MQPPTDWARQLSSGVCEIVSGDDEVLAEVCGELEVLYPDCAGCRAGLEDDNPAVTLLAVLGSGVVTLQQLLEDLCPVHAREVDVIAAGIQIVTVGDAG